MRAAVGGFGCGFVAGWLALALWRRLDREDAEWRRRDIW
jgi:NhaP-type Na+/H+ or K+/H+ antiporter